MVAHAIDYSQTEWTVPLSRTVSRVAYGTINDVGTLLPTCTSVNPVTHLPDRTAPAGGLLHTGVRSSRVPVVPYLACHSLAVVSPETLCCLYRVESDFGQA